jgi:hypothetical protein
MAFRVEVIWNREFHWSSFSNSKETLERAISSAESVMNSGDGARVKKARIIDEVTGEIVWPTQLGS